MLLLATRAWALPVLLVGDDPVTGDGATVIVKPEEGATTLTVSVQVSTTATTFGMVLPVPAGTDLATLDHLGGAEVERLDETTAPVATRFGCENLVQTIAWQGPLSGSCGVTFGNETYILTGRGVDQRTYQPVAETLSATPVPIEASYAGELVAAADLEAAITNHGWTLPDGGGDAINTQGGTFLLLTVTTDQPPDHTFVAPFVITVPTETPALPVAIGAPSLVGSGDLHVYLWGHVKLDLPVIDLDSACMPDGSLDEAYPALVDAAFGAGQLTEYQGDTVGSDTLSRVLVRGVTADIAVVAGSSPPREGALTFVHHDEDISAFFFVCGTDELGDGDTCDRGDFGSCAVPPTPAPVLPSIVIAASLLRRRR